MVTTVDAENGDRQLDTHVEAARQVAIADVALITKTDLVTADAVECLARRLRRLNPDMPIHAVEHGVIDPDRVFGVATRAVERMAETDAHDHDHEHAHHHDADVNRHGNIRAYTIQTAVPLSWDRLRCWLETVFSLRGGDFLRLKGIVAIAGEARPVVIQAVGNSFSLPSALARWPDGVRDSRIVVITQGLESDDLQQSFDDFVMGALTR